jgi:Flp pilus assembly protein TadD
MANYRVKHPARLTVPPRKATHLNFRLGTALLAAALYWSACGDDSDSPVRDRARWLNNQGVVYMDQHNYVTARGQFERAVALDSAYANGYANLGIAYFSLGKYDSALVFLTTALDRDPDHLHAHYTQGLIYHAQGQDYDRALAAFQRVLKADSDDPLVKYYLGRTMAKLGDDDGAVAEFRRAIQLDSNNVSAYYALAHQLRLQGRMDEWKETLEIFSQLSRAGHEGVSSSYQGQGKYAEALADGGFGSGGGHRLGADTPFEFADPEAAPASPPAPILFAVSVDANDDGLPDLVTGGEPALYSNRGGALSPSDAWVFPALGFSPTDAVFGDCDDDGDLDLVISGGERTALLRNEGGSFADAQALPHAGERTVFADTDHDGDLDALVIGRRGNRLLVNDGTASFAEAADAGLATDRSGRRALFSDFDNDRDVDFLLLGEPGAPNSGIELYLNNRDGTFSDMAVGTGLGQGGETVDISAGDFRPDGYIDLLALGADGALTLYANNGGRGFFPRPVGMAPGGRRGGIVTADLDNDGDLDLLTYGADGVLPLSWSGEAFSASGAALLNGLPVTCVLAEDMDGDGVVDVWADGSLFRNRTDAGNWIRVNLKGLSSNPHGIGAKVEVMASGRRQKREVRLSSRDPQVLTFGLGTADSVDFVRILWPSGVRQTELATAAGQTLQLEELNRKGTSCPVLYAWSGDGYRFVSDFLGGAIIGYLTAPGEYYTPDTDEYLPLGPITPLAGRYSFQVANQLEEIIYLDAVHLVAVDHPDSVVVFPNERLLSSPPYPEFRLYPLAEVRPPIGAVDHRGIDVLEQLLRVDDDWYDGFEEEDIHGYAREHSLTLDLGDLSQISHPVLLAHGWVNYAHSASNWAAFQRGLELFPPRLEVPDGEGGWRLLTADMGCPAGLPKYMLFDLGAAADSVFSNEDYRLRITTNTAVYWDRLAIGSAVQTPLTVHRRRPNTADLHWRGYPSHTAIKGSFAFRYHYDDIDESTDWGTHAGPLTRYGEVTSLLGEVDDRYVIMSHGDELTLEIDADSFPEIPPGSTRSFLFFADGFGKDMDFHSAHSLSVEPLPFHAMSSYPYPATEVYPQTAEHTRYNLDYNSRWTRGYYE